MLSKFDDLKDKVIVVKQIKSGIGFDAKQRANLVGLGLRGIGSQSELKCTNDVYGMLNKVHFLIDVKIK